jgi:osmotically-inducible protein OsmY
MFKTRAATLILSTCLLLPTAALAQYRDHRDDDRHYDRHFDREDAKILNRVNREIADRPSMRDVHAYVDDRILFLRGSVASYHDKLRTERILGHVKGVQGVENRLFIRAAYIPDAVLHERLARRLRYDRSGQGNVFNNLELSVSNGYVVLSGTVRTDTDRDSALAIAENCDGVRGVDDRIVVAPASFHDDELRVRVVRAVYGDPVLRRYAADPQAPIRVVVVGGHVTLYGVVASPLEREVAGIRANQVPGAFSVENRIVVNPRG